MSGDRDESAAPPRRSDAGPGRVLRYALVMLFGWTILGVVMVVAMHAALGPPPPPRGAPRVLTAVGVAPPAVRPARVAPSNTIVVAADAEGHFFVNAAVNGAPVRFLVDTGASLVALTPADARAAGLSAAGGKMTISTAHGDTIALRATVGRLRVDQLEIEDVPAVVMDDSLPVSLLGTSFLSRLNGYSIRDGILTIEW